MPSKPKKTERTHPGLCLDLLDDEHVLLFREVAFLLSRSGSRASLSDDAASQGTPGLAERQETGGAAMTSPSSLSFGAEVRRLREARKMSAAQLGRCLATSSTPILAIEAGKRYPPVGTRRTARRFSHGPNIPSSHKGAAMTMKEGRKGP